MSDRRLNVPQTSAERARLARNLAEVIYDLYRSDAPPRPRKRLLDLVQAQIERAMRLGAQRWRSRQ